MSLYLRGKVYWSRIVRGQRRVDRSTKKHNLRDAQRVEAHWLTELEETNGIIPTKKERPIHLYEFEKQFFSYLDVSVPNVRTREFYKQAWGAIKKTTLAGEHITSITPALLQTFTQEQAQRVGPSRVNGLLRTLRRALRLAEEWGVIRKAPKIKLLTGEAEREFVIGETLLKKMLVHEKCTPMLKLLLPFLIDTGLRISEALALEWADITEEKSGRAWVFIRKGKTKHAKRHVPLTERAYSILKQLPKEHRPFDTTRNWVSQQFRALRDAMKLPDSCVIHSARHTFCTNLGESGAEAFTIQKLAGHSNPTISAKYTHPRRVHLESVIEKMESKHP